MHGIFRGDEPSHNDSQIRMHCAGKRTSLDGREQVAAFQYEVYAWVGDLRHCPQCCAANMIVELTIVQCYWA